MENGTLQGFKSNACPSCEMPAGELGTNIKNYSARDYARYERYVFENRFPGSKSEGTYIKFSGLGINLGQNLLMDFTGSRQVTCTPQTCSTRFVSDYLST